MAAALLFAVAVLLYLGTLAHPFVFDDWHAVTHNPSIRDLFNVKWIFIGSRRFAVNLSYALDWAIGGGAAWAFHATNVLLHGVSTWLVFCVARRVLGGDERALFAAALFAVHPIQTEAVAYVSARPDLLCTTLSLLALLAFARGGRWLAAAFALFVAALTAKETAGVLPFAFVAWDVQWGGSGLRRRLRRFHAPLVALTAAGAVVRILSYVRLETGVTRPMWQQLLTQAEVVWRNLFLFLAPVSLSLVHSVETVTSPLDPIAWSSLAALLATAALVFVRGAPAARFGLAWFLLMLAPSSLVPLATPMAEHRVYGASAGLFLLVASLAPPRRRLAAALVLAALAALTVARTRVWATPVRLWTDAVDKAPREWGARYALGDALRDAGDCARAVTAYEAALALRPDEPRVLRNRAICLGQLGRYDEAERQWTALVEKTPGDASLWLNLGLLAATRGRCDDAATAFARARTLAPSDERVRAIVEKTGRERCP